MASFDIIESAGKSYRFVWQERRHLMRLALIPIIVKLVCHMLVMTLGWRDEYIRQALVMLPSYLADGWLLACVVRMLVFDERDARAPAAQGEETGRRERDALLGITAGMAVFATTRFFLAGLVAVIYVFAEQSRELVDAENVHFGWYLGSIAMMFGMIWGFRLLWLYIPAALNMSLRGYITGLGGLMSSFYMIGIWLVCMAPLLVLFTMLSLFILVPYGAELASVPAAAQFLLSIIHVTLDTAINILTTAGITFGLIGMQQAAQNKNR